MGVKQGLGVITKQKKANWISYVVCRYYLLKRVIQQKTGWVDEEENVSCPCMTLRKTEETGIWKRKHYNTLSGELTLEQVMDLFQDRLQNEWRPVNTHSWHHLQCLVLASQPGGRKLRKTVILRFQFFKDDLQYHIPEEQILHQHNCKNLKIHYCYFLES